MEAVSVADILLASSAVKSTRALAFGKPAMICGAFTTKAVVVTERGLAKGSGKPGSIMRFINLTMSQKYI